ncbi:hypothetical protein JCM5296_007489 [Sporobolomyces johnsonii]
MATFISAPSPQLKLQVTNPLVEPEDMLECVQGQLLAFGTRTSSGLEPLEIRAPAPFRYARFAERHVPPIGLPDAIVLKVTVADPEGGKPKLDGLA